MVLLDEAPAGPHLGPRSPNGGWMRLCAHGAVRGSFGRRWPHAPIPSRNECGLRRTFVAGRIACYSSSSNHRSLAGPTV